MGYVEDWRLLIPISSPDIKGIEQRFFWMTLKPWYLMSNYTLKTSCNLQGKGCCWEFNILDCSKYMERTKKLCQLIPHNQMQNIGTYATFCYHFTIMSAVQPHNNKLESFLTGECSPKQTTFFPLCLQQWQIHQ